MAEDQRERPIGGYYVYATTSGVRLHNGRNLHFTKGEAWPVDDPFVTANRDLFQSEPPNVRESEPSSDKVERATRAPGEKRTPGRRPA